MIVCLCKSVTDRDIARAIGAGACSLADVAHLTGAGLGCGTCHESIRCALVCGELEARHDRVASRSDVAPRPVLVPSHALRRESSQRRVVCT
ncbi:MAG: (2Fe-2S)-binding protein [Myxococcales bacterium]|nr:(2Fe-2S)-binding protein [Myxococcales bacterium]